MIRGTHGVNFGAYYWEIHILDPPVENNAIDTTTNTTAIDPTTNTSSKTSSNSNSHFRVGWSTRQGELEGPVGFDKFSFGYRDMNGSKVHDSVRNDEYGESYSAGDVIGCLIILDDNNLNSNQMRFYKNGIDQGIAFSGKEIPSGVYFPAVSLYMKVFYSFY
jgi:hypothetical protein